MLCKVLHHLVLTDTYIREILSTVHSYCCYTAHVKVDKTDGISLNSMIKSPIHYPNIYNIAWTRKHSKEIVYNRVIAKNNRGFHVQKQIYIIFLLVHHETMESLIIKAEMTDSKQYSYSYGQLTVRRRPL